MFGRFLRFGFLAFGGPFAQIGMMHEEIVTRERWIPQKQFNRVLGIFQALPGPEAMELAVYFGYVRRGRLGGLLAGLGFVLPGFFLMLLVSWAYVTYGSQLEEAAPFLYGFQAVVIGVLVSALLRIGEHTYTQPRWWMIGLLALATGWFWDLNLALLALGGGVLALLLRFFRRGGTASAVLPVLFLIPWARLGAWGAFGFFFLKAGLLTFGGAYTVLPFLQEGAVEEFGWLTNEQFLDGIALGGLLPAPLIIVATFVGYVAAGWTGAVVATALIFLPAFLFTLVGFQYIQRLVDNPHAHDFFDGVTAAVVALIALVAIRLAPTALPDGPAALIALLGLLALRLYKANVALVVLGGGLLGALIQVASRG